MVDRRYLVPYLRLLACALALAVVQLVLHPGVFVAMAVAGGTSLLLIRLSRRELQVRETLPELTKVPLLGRLLS